VSKGQWEAARSQGMRASQMYIYIILPQALRNMIPALLSQAITVIKDTAFLRMAMAYPELLGRIIVLTSKYTAVVQIFALYGLAMLIYFVICFILSQLVRHFQKKLQAEAQSQAR
jgi:putative glutamine transport system permease protein